MTLCLLLSLVSGNTLIDVPHGLLRWALGRAPRRAADRGMRNGGQASSAGSARLIELLNFECLDNGPNRGPPSGYVGRFL